MISEYKIEDIDDPIDEALPLLIEAAHRHCKGKHDENNRCFQYHRTWPYLRRIGFKPSVWIHGENYVNSFRRLAREGRNNYFISGCADYAMLAHILYAYQKEKVIPKITILDYCQSPLSINQWYANRMGFKIDTIAQSILEYESSSNYDVVTTDLFLGQFTDDERSIIIKKWHSLLKPGGKLISTHGIRPKNQVEPQVKSENELLSNKDFVLERARSLSSFIDIAPETLADYALSQSRCKIKRNLKMKTLEELEVFLSTNGFKIESTIPVKPERRKFLQVKKNDRNKEKVFFEAAKIDLNNLK